MVEREMQANDMMLETRKKMLKNQSKLQFASSVQQDGLRGWYRVSFKQLPFEIEISEF